VPAAPSRGGGRRVPGARPPAAAAVTDPGLIAYGTLRGRWVIAATVLGSGIASLDATVVGIALPAIGRRFDAGVGTLQWVATGYTLTLAAFLLLGGALGDRFGRRRLFSIGVVWFALASAGCGLAPTAPLLIAARALQGIGAALLVPASLAILESSFRDEDRSRAIGAWSGLGGLATAAGPLLGGYLISAASWRWVFFINLPVAAAVLFLTARHVPESCDPTTDGPVDLPGAALAVLLLAGLTYGLIEGPSAGWSAAAVIAGLALAAVAAPLLVVLERSRSNPMLPLELFRQRQFSAANAVTFVVYGALAGALFLLPVELQIVDHYSPLQAGVSLLPVTAIMLAFSARSALLAARIGPRLQMSAGPVVVGVGLVLLTRATHGTDYLTLVLPAVVVFGVGLAITVAPLTAAALRAAPAERAGVASAVNNVVARSAGLLSVAVLPVAAGLSGTLTAHGLAPGFRTAMLIAGSACAAGGVLAAVVIRNPSAASERSSLRR
jgi:EmrB/QacA subfamily drug resistance transporter